MKYELKEWVEKSRSGDREARQIILDRLRPLMISLIRRYGRGEWEDLMQEAGETVLRCIHEYREERNVPFVVFVQKALYYRIRNLARQRPAADSLDTPVPGREFSLIESLESEDPLPQERLEREESCGRVREALQMLSREQKEVLLLHFYSGIHLKDIALARGVHYQTIKGLKKRGLKQLKKILTPYIHPDGN